MMNNKGFTLIEMMVAVSLFSVVMTISTGALLSLLDANRKAQSIQSVMNNLNIALDGMVRNVRMGTNYSCRGGNTTNNNTLATRKNCSSGEELLAFESFNGTSSNADQWVYWIDGGRLYKSTDSRSTSLPITAPEIHIDSFEVYVTGAAQTLSSNGDVSQPKAVFVIQGTAGSEDSPGLIGGKLKTRTTFNIQATASQRILDL
ncbi:hypothetical protein COB52_01255 [Candidatus Kaiserbacteria bacterium]|nr:MAG: hypothetical protein COB52_01255 [Candidatus Kaiserbacteria bacterium]